LYRFPLEPQEVRHVLDSAAKVLGRRFGGHGQGGRRRRGRRGRWRGRGRGARRGRRLGRRRGGAQLLDAPVRLLQLRPQRCGLVGVPPALVVQLPPQTLRLPDSGF